MGNSKSTESNEIVHVNHPYFGEIQIITHEKQKYMKISMVSDGKRSIAEWESNQDLLKDLDIEPLLLAVDHKYEEQGMCGSTGVLHILYENHPVILKDQIQNRRASPEYFEEREIWYLLHILITSATQFHTQGKKVGDIRPDSIFINQQGQVKVANICSWPRQENNYFKSLNDKEETYLAPEEMNELQKNNIIPETDQVKAESFSIGLTLLDAITLTDSSKCYNFQNCTFDVSKLQELLAKLHSEEEYSYFLKEIVVDLLHLDPRLRKSAEEIYQRILSYQYNIKNLIAFAPNPHPIIQGSKSVVSAYNQTLPGYVNPGYIPNYPNVGFTQSIYENKNVQYQQGSTYKVIPSPPTIQNIIGNGTSNHGKIITSSPVYNPIPGTNFSQTPISYAPKQYSSVPNGSQYPSVQEHDTGKYATTTYQSSIPNTNYPNRLPLQSKKQLWDEIDRQIERSRKLFQ